MAISVKQLLLLILFVGFALAALANSERTFMVEMVKLVTFFTLVVMAYSAWSNVGERRAYCAGFVLWGGIYYTLFVVMRSHRVDLGTETFLLWLGPKLDSGRIMWAVFEKTGHLLFSLLFGIIGAWVTVHFYRRRQRIWQASGKQKN
jgi:hypothetical protein